MKKIFSLTNVFIKEFYQSLAIFDKDKKKFNKKSMFFWLMAIVFLGVTYVSYEIIIFLSDVGQPKIFLNLYFLLLTILLLFQIILVCANIFFFSKDIEKVLPLPLKPLELLLAKLNTLLCMLYVSEGILGLVPLTLYGLLNHVHFLFYFWEIFILIVFPILLAVVVITFLLIIMRFAKFIRNKEIFQFIITVILIVMICLLESKAFNGLFSIKNNEQALEQFTSISERAEQVGRYFLIINPSVSILTNPSSIVAIVSSFELLFYNILGIAIFIAIGQMTYLKDILKNIVSYTNRKKKKVEIEKDVKCHRSGSAYIRKEFKMLIREPIFFMQCVFPVIIILVTGILLLVVLIPIIENVMQNETIHTAIENLSFNAEAVCDILIVLQVLFTLSNISLTSISREGKNAIFIKYIPIELYKQFLYKNIPQVILNLIISVIVLGMLWYFIPIINILYLFLIFIISVLINLINSYLMLIVDLRRPNLDWDTEYSAVKKSDNKLFQYVLMIVNVLFLMYIANIFKEENILVNLIGEIIIFAIIFIGIDRGVKKWQNKLFNNII